MKEKKITPVVEEPSNEPEARSGESPLKLAFWILGLPLGVIVMIMAIQSLL
jgi:hypothetical protein